MQTIIIQEIGKASVLTLGRLPDTVSEYQKPNSYWIKRPEDK